MITLDLVACETTLYLASCMVVGFIPTGELKVRN